MKKIIGYLLCGMFGVLFLGMVGGNVYAQKEGEEAGSGKCGGQKCNGVKLNTCFPIIGDCIETGSKSEENPTNAFPTMIGAITKIVISLSLVVCFILIIRAGVMRSGNKPKEGKELLKKVAIAILLLGFSGVILRLINPNFFS